MLEPSGTQRVVAAAATARHGLATVTASPHRADAHVLIRRALALMARVCTCMCEVSAVCFALCCAHALSRSSLLRSFSSSPSLMR